MTEHLEPGYAQTSHATQGRTVDTALFLLDSPTDNRGVYTPMTRGRETNHAYVVVVKNQTALDALTHAIARDWIDQPALARKAQLIQHRSPTLSGHEESDELDELGRNVRRLNEMREIRSRESDHSLSRGLGR